MVGYSRPSLLPLLLVLFESLTTVAAFTPCRSCQFGQKISPTNVALTLGAPTKSTRLYNIPPPSEEDAVATKLYADKEAPPASFYELQINSSRAARLAMRDGHQLIEVEFPPLPANVLEMDDVSAYDVAQANLKLAIDFSKFFAQDGKKVAV